MVVSKGWNADNIIVFFEELEALSSNEQPEDGDKEASTAKYEYDMNDESNEVRFIISELQCMKIKVKRRPRSTIEMVC